MLPKKTIGSSRIEALAARSVEYGSLGHFNLVSARAKLSELLAGIGNTAEFSTYTKHDITHIDALLASTDWLIPQETWEHLTVADALILTLSIYVHDLGMLVTANEYKERERTSFPAFRDSLFGDESARGIDFRDRLRALEPEDREHFVYEEFVRIHHAHRIEAWILGSSYEQYGVSAAAVSLVEEVFRDLDPVIRHDIALIARSHHLDDLDDLQKYKTNRSYGNSRDEEANIHYSAIILRTADLIHMTRDRTPTIQFALSSPTDPLGQREWRKQAAVRAVKPAARVSGPPVAIEVHATFNDPDGYFALMEYLDYCDSQLLTSSVWADRASTAEVSANRYRFPWTEMDRGQVEANGFNRNQFSFSFDQQKVLDLLTGHTLYNDASVAVREIAQNAIDAVRLQRHLSDTSDAATPDVVIEYAPEQRILTVRDRGVGMTESALQNHFLRVGSSSYQSKEFREKNPGFASISRFGIGVLSAFMIADEVNVATVSVDEPFGRELVLKSVHGRYLMRDLASNSEAAQRIGKHGTEIQLKLRASSEFDGSIIDLLRRWIVIPRCSVVCRVEGHADVPIGWSDPKSALEGLLALTVSTSQQLRVTPMRVRGHEIAIAEVWNPYFKEWEILRFNESSSARFITHAPPTSDEAAPPNRHLAGVCIQGVRVTSDLPGWSDSPIILVDVSGLDAPRTNVARTDLEAGQTLDALVESIYSAVLESVRRQLPELTSRASLRYALKEAHHLFAQATRADSGHAYSKPKAMRKILSEFALHPVEVNSILESRSVEQLRATGFSVLIGPAADDAARFMDWLPVPKGMMAILREGGLLTDVEENPLPLLGGREPLFSYDQLLWESFQISGLRALEGGRSLILDFSLPEFGWRGDAFSAGFPAAVNMLSGMFERGRFGRRRDYVNSYCSDETVTFSDLPGGAEIVFVGAHRLFGPRSKFSELRTKIQASDEVETAISSAALYMIANEVTPTIVRQPDSDDDVFANALETWLRADEQVKIPFRMELAELIRSAATVPVWSTSTAWQRRDDRFPG